MRALTRCSLILRFLSKIIMGMFLPEYLLQGQVQLHANKIIHLTCTNTTFQAVEHSRRVLGISKLQHEPQTRKALAHKQP
jgi:hypothetical protein